MPVNENLFMFTFSQGQNIFFLAILGHSSQSTSNIRRSLCILIPVEYKMQFYM